MNPLYEKYKNLKIDGSWIGLEAGTQTPCFCTPIGAEIIGWDNGIHYCFIKGFGDMVFCVNPETCCDYNVYPIARNFCDFLGLILVIQILCNRLFGGTKKGLRILLIVQKNRNIEFGPKCKVS
jgi:hypothetical protein